MIENISFYAVQNLTTPPDVGVTFWSSDDQNTTVLAGAPATAVRMLGFERVEESDFFRQGAGVTTSLWRAHVGGLNIPYQDDDSTGEFHITVENEQTTNLAAGKTRLEFGFRPIFGG